MASFSYPAAGSLVFPPSTGGGGGGAVDSVNGQTGVVVLAANDVGAANRTLSNLTSPTAFNQDLLPNADRTLALGSSAAALASSFVLTSATDSIEPLTLPQPDDSITVSVAGGSITANGATGAKLNVNNTTVSLEAFDDLSGARELVLDGKDRTLVNYNDTVGTTYEALNWTTSILKAYDSVNEQEQDILLWNEVDENGSPAAKLSARLIPSAHNTYQLGESATNFSNVFTQRVESSNLSYMTLGSGTNPVELLAQDRSMSISTNRLDSAASFTLVTNVAGTDPGTSSGDIQLQSQSVTGIGALSGTINLITGSSSDSRSGDINLLPGTTANTLAGGNIKLQAGSVVSGNFRPGVISLIGGTGISRPGGNVVITGGASSTGNGGAIALLSGATAGAARSGAIDIQTNANNNGGNSGNIQVSSGQATTGAGVSGTLDLLTGTSDAESGAITLRSGIAGTNSGSVTLGTGDAVTSGDFNILVGSGTSAAGGVSIQAGGTTNPAAPGGVVVISAGSGGTGLNSINLIASVLNMPVNSADPTNGVTAGSVYFNNSSGKLRVFNGTTWEEIQSV